MLRYWYSRTLSDPGVQVRRERMLLIPATKCARLGRGGKYEIQVSGSAPAARFEVWGYFCIDDQRAVPREAKLGDSSDRIISLGRVSTHSSILPLSGRVSDTRLHTSRNSTQEAQRQHSPEAHEQKVRHE